VNGARNGGWGLSSPRVGGGSGRFGMGVWGSRTRAAERRIAWIRISGGYCFGIALGRDTRSKSVAESSDDAFGGRSLRGLFPEAIFLRALRTEAISKPLRFGSGRHRIVLHVDVGIHSNERRASFQIVSFLPKDMTVMMMTP